MDRFNHHKHWFPGGWNKWSQTATGIDTRHCGNKPYEQGFIQPKTPITLDIKATMPRCDTRDIDNRKTITSGQFRCLMFIWTAPARRNASAIDAGVAWHRTWDYWLCDRATQISYRHSNMTWRIFYILQLSSINFKCNLWQKLFIWMSPLDFLFQSSVPQNDKTDILYQNYNTTLFDIKWQTTKTFKQKSFYSQPKAL